MGIALVSERYILILYYLLVFVRMLNGQGVALNTSGTQLLSLTELIPGKVITS